MKHDYNRYLNKKFNMLYVEAFHKIKKVKQNDRIRNKYLYKCLCDCGAYKILPSTELGKTESCGCIFKDRLKIGHAKQKGKPRPSIQKPNGESVLHSMYLAYKSSAKKRNKEFKLSKSAFARLTSKNCHYCGCKPTLTKKCKKDFVSRYVNGIDRINSKIGYVEDNCVPCCKRCNYMKHELTVDEWLKHIRRVLNHLIEPLK